MILLELFLAFLKVGCFSFGGAYFAIPLIRETVLSHGWLSDETVSYMIAVSESTPGPIMVNMATYVGSSQAGFLGALVATFAVVFPSFLVILLVCVLMKAFIKNAYVQAVLRGMKPCITGIILATGMDMLVKNCGFPVGPDYKAMILTAVLAFLFFGSERVLKIKLSPIALIGISGILGIAVYGF